MLKEGKILILFILFFCLVPNKEIFAISGYNFSQDAWIKPGYNEQGGIGLLYANLVIKTEIAGKKCVATDIENGNNFINFNVDDSFIFDGSSDEVILTVEYFDIGNDTFAIQYCSSHPWPYEGAFMRAGKIITKQNTKKWKTYTTTIRNVRFANRQGYGPLASALLSKGGGDFRINNRGDGDEYISYAAIRIPYMTIAVNELGNIFQHKEDVSISVNLNNKENKPFSSILEYKVLDFNETLVQSKEEDITIPKASILSYPIKIKVDKNGIFFIYVKLRKGNEVIEERRTTFAVCPASIQKQSFYSPFGVAALLQRGEIDRMIKVLKRLNISWVRQCFRPEEAIGKEKGKFNWGMSDIAVGRCYANGINICGIFLGGSGPDPTTGSEKAIEYFSTFASNAAYRYKDKIKYWEIWNEPDLRGFWPGGPSPANYTKLLKACYTSIKKIDPASKILVGGLAGGQKNRFWFLDHIYKNEGGNYFDIVAIHPYTAPDPPEKGDALEKKINDAAGRIYGKPEVKKRVWITEIGWPTAREGHGKDVSTAAQANFLVRSYIIALSNPNVDKVFWHCFRNYGLDPEAPQQNFGLVNNDFTPKPAAVAYLNMVNQIGGLKFIGRLELENPLRGYIFGDGKKEVKVLWSVKGSKVLNLPLKTKLVSLTDIMGNTDEREAMEGEIRLLLTESPIFLEER